MNPIRAIDESVKAAGDQAVASAERGDYQLSEAWGKLAVDLLTLRTRSSALLAAGVVAPPSEEETAELSEPPLVMQPADAAGSESARATGSGGGGSLSPAQPAEPRNYGTTTLPVSEAALLRACEDAQPADQRSRREA